MGIKEEAKGQGEGDINNTAGRVRRECKHAGQARGIEKAALQSVGQACIRCGCSYVGVACGWTVHGLSAAGQRRWLCNKG